MLTGLKRDFSELIQYNFTDLKPMFQIKCMHLSIMLRYFCFINMLSKYQLICLFIGMKYCF